MPKRSAQLWCRVAAGPSPATRGPPTETDHGCACAATGHGLERCQPPQLGAGHGRQGADGDGVGQGENCSAVRSLALYSRDHLHWDDRALMRARVWFLVKLVTATTCAATTVMREAVDGGSRTRRSLTR